MALEVDSVVKIANDATHGSGKKIDAGSVGEISRIRRHNETPEGFSYHVSFGTKEWPYVIGVWLPACELTEVAP